MAHLLEYPVSRNVHIEGFGDRHAATAAVRPLFEEWLERRHGRRPTFRLTQVITRHGSFGRFVFVFWIRRDEKSGCQHWDRPEDYFLFNYSEAFDRDSPIEGPYFAIFQTLPKNISFQGNIQRLRSDFHQNSHWSERQEPILGDWHTGFGDEECSRAKESCGHW